MIAYPSLHTLIGYNILIVKGYPHRVWLFVGEIQV